MGYIIFFLVSAAVGVAAYRAYKRGQDSHKSHPPVVIVKPDDPTKPAP